MKALVGALGFTGHGKTYTRPMFGFMGLRLSVRRRGLAPDQGNRAVSDHMVFPPDCSGIQPLATHAALGPAACGQGGQSQAASLCAAGAASRNALNSAHTRSIA